MDSPVEFLVNEPSVVVQNGADDIGNPVEYLRRPDRRVFDRERRDLVAADAVDAPVESGLHHPTGTHRARFGARVQVFRSRQRHPEPVFAGVSALCLARPRYRGDAPPVSAG
jgi:hypothetical protein